MKGFGDYLAEKVRLLGKENDLLKEKDLNIGAYLMCPPYGMSADIPNNALMKELSSKDRQIDIEKAVREWINLYYFISNYGIVYLLPPIEGLQDQTYTANLGIVLPHLKNTTVVISNFRSQVRTKETPEGIDFFKKMNYNVAKCPFKFEGEADLKYLGKNNYAGGYGIRSEKDAYSWFEKEFDMKVIKVEMSDEKLYHFDCMFLPISSTDVACCTELMDDASVKKLEAIANVYDVPLEACYAGFTNSVVFNRIICCESQIRGMKATDERYERENLKIMHMNKICAKVGFEPIFFSLSEFEKSGGDLSCLVMHLSYPDFMYPIND